MILLRFFSTITLGLFLGGFAFAQSADTEGDAPAVVQSGPSKITKGDKKTSINFEDELIEGTSQKPDMFYIFQKNNIKFKKLVKLRENFLPEMNRSAEDIQRLRGGR